MDVIEWVSPGDLRMPPSRQSPDAVKLNRHLRLHGDRFDGMPPLEVFRCKDDLLLISSGVTRAIRAFHYGPPDQTVPVIVTARYPKRDISRQPAIRDW